jgi:nitroimidazol reductase NimA-like FMN-containing flavoprotein (pyridoxamine 5'-phosphate oxidase superfamily)
MTDGFTPTARTTLKRLPKRAEYDRAAIYDILDEGFVCHVGFAIDGHPFVIPTGYARIEDSLYIHGSAASRMLKAIEGGIEVAVTVTLVDGLVLARSAFHHSMNYRSVMVFGRADVVEDPEEKMEALRALTEHIVPGRWAEVRWPYENEMRATLVLRLVINEVSAKVRTGGPIDDEADYALEVWAGEIPIRTLASDPVADRRMQPGIEPPPYVWNYTRTAERSKRP